MDWRVTGSLWCIEIRSIIIRMCALTRVWTQKSVRCGFQWTLLKASSVEPAQQSLSWNQDVNMLAHCKCDFVCWWRENASEKCTRVRIASCMNVIMLTKIYRRLFCDIMSIWQLTFANVKTEELSNPLYVLQYSYRWRTNLFFQFTDVLKNIENKRLL